MTTLRARLQAALSLHQQGRLDEAADAYQAVLRDAPADPDALNLLGVVYSQQHKHPRAIALLMQAIASKKNFEEAWLNLGKTFSAMGRFQEAIGACDAVLRIAPARLEALATQARCWRKLKDARQALKAARACLKLHPGHPEMSRLEASCLVELKEFEAAQRCYEACLKISPDDAALKNDQAMLLVEQGRSDEAIELLRTLSEGDKPFLPACSNLGNLLNQRGQPDEALRLHEKVVALDPRMYAGWINYANVLQAQKQHDQARQALETAIALKPDRAEAHVNLSGVLSSLNQEPLARGALLRGIELAPDFPDAWNNLGAMELDSADVAKAQIAYARAIALNPALAAAQFGLGLSHLMQGNFAQGWPQYEWRWSGASQSKPDERPRFGYPQWKGEKTRKQQDSVLVYHEQGFGDTIQFLRFVPALTDHFQQVTLVIQPPLWPLVRHGLPPAIEVLTSEQGQERVRTTPYHWHCPMGSLPLALKLDSPDRIPHRDHYLQVLPERELPAVLAQRRMQCRQDQRPLIGLCWAGNPGLAHNKTRSLDLEQLRPLVSATPATWVSVQRDLSERERACLQELGVLDLSEGIRDFADTATILQSLDLVISVDTVIVHLAGALGVPCWLLNRYQSEWRWMHGTERSVWYDSVRQWRQTRKNGWADVIDAIQAELNAAGHRIARPAAGQLAGSGSPA